MEYIVHLPHSRRRRLCMPGMQSLSPGAQWAKFAEKVQKPPLQVNVINFELDGLDASIINMGPLESLRPQKVMIL